LTRCLVQSYVEISLFPLDESASPSAINNTFLSFRIRDKSHKTVEAMKKAAAPSILVAVIVLAVAVVAEAQQPKKGIYEAARWMCRSGRDEYSSCHQASDYNHPYIPSGQDQLRGVESLKIQT
jgi:hypothetical protein